MVAKLIAAVDSSAICWAPVDIISCQAGDVFGGTRGGPGGWPQIAGVQKWTLLNQLKRVHFRKLIRGYESYCFPTIKPHIMCIYIYIYASNAYKPVVLLQRWEYLQVGSLVMFVGDWLLVIVRYVCFFVGWSCALCQFGANLKPLPEWGFHRMWRLNEAADLRPQNLSKSVMTSGSLVAAHRPPPKTTWKWTDNSLFDPCARNPFATQHATFRGVKDCVLVEGGELHRVTEI